MNLFNVKYFIDSAKLGSMSAAAELNCLSRPAISHAIKKLEDDLGFKLIEHRRRSFDLTRAGIAFLQSSQVWLDQLDEIKLRLSQVKSSPSGTYRIGCARTLATFMLPRSIDSMRIQFPNIEFKIKIANSETLVSMLENKELDLALYLGDDTLNGYVETIIGRGSFMLIKPKSKPLKDVTYALTDRRPETERAKTLYRRKFSCEIPIFAEIPSWDSIWYWTESGICGGLVPSFLARQPKNKGRVDIVMPKVFPYEIKALHSKTRADDDVICGLVDHLRR